MISLRCVRYALLGVALLSCRNGPLEGALAPSNVLVLYNTASPDGLAIADYYAQVHPGVTLLGINGVTTSEDITADNYLSVMRPQILSALNQSVNVIVTTKGLPLRVDVTESNPSTYKDPFGVTRTIYSGWWKPYSSLESDLTRIDEISTWQQMGDQTYFSQSGMPKYPEPSCNPYYGATTSFNYNNYVMPGYGGMRLTARLDGFTTADVETAITKAQRAYIIPNSTCIVADNDPGANSADQGMVAQLATNVLAPGKLPYVYDNTSAAVTTAAGPVIGYVSQGVHSASLSPGYITNQLNFTLANGAVFDTHESYNAYSFQPGGNVGGQGLVAEWLQIGGTAGVGNVQEPSAGSCYEANEAQMFKMLLNGYTWAEAAWSSLQQLSYVNTVVGDPLMTWKPAILGDANLDGTVNGADLSTVLANYNQTGTDWAHGDFNGDGTINGADLNDVLMRFNSTSDVLTGVAVPEPGTLATLALAALAALVGHGRRKRQ